MFPFVCLRYKIYHKFLKRQSSLPFLNLTVNLPHFIHYDLLQGTRTSLMFVTKILDFRTHIEKSHKFLKRQSSLPFLNGICPISLWFCLLCLCLWLPCPLCCSRHLHSELLLLLHCLDHSTGTFRCFLPHL